MIRTKKFFDPVQLGVVAGVLYTVGTSLRAVGKQMAVSNTTGTARTLTVYLVPSGGVPGVANTMISAKVIPPTGQGNLSLADLFNGQVLNEGDTIQALASAAAALTLHASGFEETV